MASLILDKFRCITQTESGDDSPYFVIFSGPVNARAGAHLTIVRNPTWDNDVIDTPGHNEFKSGATIATGDPANTLVLCALVEEDGNPDFAASSGRARTVRQTCEC